MSVSLSTTDLCPNSVANSVEDITLLGSLSGYNSFSLSNSCCVISNGILIGLLIIGYSSQELPTQANSCDPVV